MSAQVAGLTFEEKKCPKCGGVLFRKPCPCPMKRQGWETCARCLNPACGTIVGLKMSKSRRFKLRRRKKSALGPFAISN